MGLSAGMRVRLGAEKPVAGGRMLARHDGQVVLLAGAIPGETVEARITRVARGTVYADTEQVLESSPDRRPGVDGGCGGAVYGHIGYPRQLALKAAIIEDAWRRIARQVLDRPVQVVSSPERGYRTRARLHARDGRFGFYREGTHVLCDPAATGQLAEPTVAWIREAEATLGPARVRSLAAIDVVENAAGSERACHLHTHGSVSRTLDALAGGLTGVSAAPAVDDDEDTRHRGDERDVVSVAGDPAVTDIVSFAAGSGHVSVSLRHSARSFFQGNRFLLAPLVQTVVDAVPAGEALDLFAGTGLFGLAVAAAGRGAVTAVEGDPSSSRDLAANADAAGTGVQVHRQSVEAFLSAPRSGPATWIVDPPRAGLPDVVRAAVLRDRPARLVYVSCDPATLARDARTLIDGGYRMRALTGLDMFPSTAHVEAVCALDA